MEKVKSPSHSKNALPHVIFWLCMIALFWVYDYHRVLHEPPRGPHYHRQTDGLSLTLNYYKGGMHFFNPELHYTYDSPEGKAVSEFPGLYYLVAALWHLTGQSEGLFRMLSLLFVVGGLWLHYRAFAPEDLPPWMKVFIPIILFTSPVLAIYAFNFIPNTVALGFVLASVFFLLSYIREGRKSHLVLFFICTLLAGLLKITSITIFLSAGALFLLEASGLWKRKSEHTFFRHKVLFAALSLLTLVLISAWYAWSKAYNAENHCMIFLQTTRPLWKVDPALFQQTVSKVFLRTLPWFLSAPLCFLLLVSLWGLGGKSHSPLMIFLKGMTLLTLLSVLAQFLLFFEAYREHDYYLTEWLCLPALSFPLFFMRWKEERPRILPEWVMAGLFSIALLVSFYDSFLETRKRYYAKEVTRMPFHSWFISQEELELEMWFQWYYRVFVATSHGVQPKLRALGISREAKFIVVEDKTPNAILYFLDQRGLPVRDPESLDMPAVMKDLVAKGGEYLYLNRANSVDAEWARPYCRKLVFRDGDVSVWDIRGIRPES